MLGFLKRVFEAPAGEVYGLDHAVLNVQLPPQSMWMNMGYWEVSLSFENIELCQSQKSILTPSVHDRLPTGLPSPAGPGTRSWALD